VLGGAGGLRRRAFQSLAQRGRVLAERVELGRILTDGIVSLPDPYRRAIELRRAAPRAVAPTERRGT